jgi:hypothetical protein
LRLDLSLKFDDGSVGGIHFGIHNPNTFHHRINLGVQLGCGVAVLFDGFGRCSAVEVGQGEREREGGGIEKMYSVISKGKRGEGVNLRGIGGVG